MICVLSSLAHAGADHGELSAAQADTPCTTPGLPPTRNALVVSSAASNAASSGCATAIATLLSWRFAHRARVRHRLPCFCALSFALVPFLRRDFFPTVDAGQIRLHVRAPIGTRIEETASAVRRRSQKAIRQIMPPDEIGTIIDNIGLPISGINMAYGNTGTIGTSDGDILDHAEAKTIRRPPSTSRCASSLPQRFPGHHLLLPARRHRQPDSELRLAGADRRAGARRQSRGQLRLCQQAARADPHAFPAWRTCASSNRRAPDLQRRRRPHPRAICRA